MLRKIIICESIDKMVAPLVINAALLISNSIRKDVVLTLHVQDIGIVQIYGKFVRRIYPDTESILGLLRSIKKGKVIRGVRILETCPEEFRLGICPLETELSNSNEVIIDPLKCRYLQGYEIDQKIIIINMELDNMLIKRGLESTICNRHSR